MSKLSISEYILAGSLSLVLDATILAIFDINVEWFSLLFWIPHTIVFMIIWGNLIWYMKHLKK